MTYSEAIELLDKQKWAFIYSTDLQVSLDNAEHYVKDIFGIASTQLSNYSQLKSDFSISKITLHDVAAIRDNENKFKKRATDHMNGLINYLREKERIEIKEQVRQEQKKRDDEERKKNYQEERQKNQEILESKPAVKPLTKPIKKETMETHDKKHYRIGIGIFWTVALGLAGIIFYFGYYVGTAKFDSDKNELYNSNQELIATQKALQDSIKTRDITIKYLRHNSDSAHNILSHMPYNEMTLDTLSYRKVQTTIENAGAVLNLNK